MQLYEKPFEQDFYISYESKKSKQLMEKAYQKSQRDAGVFYGEAHTMEEEAED